MDLKQGGRSVHDFSKQFNHLAQYAPDQLDTNEKKSRFMIGLSIRLQERMTLNTGGTFPVFGVGCHSDDRWCTWHHHGCCVGVKLRTDKSM
jgi:hypothetical protein